MIQAVTTDKPHSKQGSENFKSLTEFELGMLERDQIIELRIKLNASLELPRS
jgi:hypothetical protein